MENLGAPEPNTDGSFVSRNNLHLTTTTVVDVTGDTARARSRYLFMTRTPRIASPWPSPAARAVYR